MQTRSDLAEVTANLQSKDGLQEGGAVIQDTLKPLGKCRMIRRKEVIATEL